MKRTSLMLCGWLAACGVVEPEQSQCRLSSDCRPDEVCRGYRCLLVVPTDPQDGRGGTTPTPAGGNWVARSRADHELDLNARYLSEADVARLVGEPLPLEWTRGPEVRRRDEPAERYYTFRLDQVGLQHNRAYLLTFVDPSKSGEAAFAQFGGEKNFADLASSFRLWLCQYRNNQSPARCVTDIFVGYDGRLVRPAGVDECLRRIHDVWCPNPHR